MFRGAKTEYRSGDSVTKHRWSCKHMCMVIHWKFKPRLLRRGCPFTLEPALQKTLLPLVVLAGTLGSGAPGYVTKLFRSFRRF